MSSDSISPPEPQGTAQWKSRPVFISSTFRDMQRERDWLNNHVFPRIREELAKRRHHLEPIDLRLGVETAQAGSEEARELLVLKVCLDEIKRSRPFLLVLLGDRYGWVPPEERIESAAREQGFEISPAGKSVTALEIEFGIFKDDPGQKHRSLFFFRKPLPYDGMPESKRADFSDAHSSNPQVRADHAKLTALKEKISADPELAGHVHEYSASWNPQTNDISGLETFGNLVFEKLWAVIDEDTKDFASQPAPTWEEQERAAIADFVEHRSRGFVGREDLLEKLSALATSSTDHFSSACVTSSPGSGKSAVFAKLHSVLEADRSLMLLSNAAGGTQRGSSVDSMLRRWIGELSQSAGVGIALPENASNDDVDAAFYSLLHRVSAQRRLVVLLDALDQFESTPRGRHLTWFKPQQWPPNARLIATAIPGTASAALVQWSGTTELELPPLTADDAQAIGKHVWGRYHRTLNAAVLAVLVEKKVNDGTPACGNPLWLTLALEQLNLLDADDFARAERDFTGCPGERLTELLLDTSRRMPSDIEGLYSWLLEQNEKAFGLAQTRAFATAIALSRSGWRESDLLDLVPRLAQIHDPAYNIQNSKFDILSLSTLRRSYRAHLVRRGENEQLDYFHAQMRRAVVARCAPDEEFRRRLHASISDYLETLPGRDPLIRLEMMGQLINERNALRAGRYCVKFEALLERTSDRLGPTWTLVEWVAEAESAGHDNPNLGWIVTWLQQPELTNEQIHDLSLNFQYGLFELMGNNTMLPTRQKLIDALCKTLERLAALNSDNKVMERDLLVSYFKIGGTLSKQGYLDGALQAFRKYQSGMLCLATGDPSNAGNQSDLSLSYFKIGETLSNQGDLDGALRAFRNSLALRERQAAVDSSNSSLQCHMSVIHDHVGDMLHDQGDLDGALRHYRISLTIRERLVAEDPTNTRWKRDGEPLVVPVNVDLSIKGWQNYLSMSHGRIGSVLQKQGDLDGAFRAFRESLQICEFLTAADPDNAYLKRCLSGCNNQMGDVLLAQGDIEGALRAFEESLRINVTLAQADSGNAVWQRDLVMTYWRMGQVTERNGTCDAREFWHKAYAQLYSMKQLGIMFPTDEERLEFLRQKAKNWPEFTEVVTVGHSTSAPRGSTSPPRVSQTPELTPQIANVQYSRTSVDDQYRHQKTPGIKPKIMATEELRKNAEDNYRRQRWELAQTYFSRLLDQGEPIAEMVPQLVTCLLNAHEDLLPSTCARIEELLTRLESSGHTDLAQQVRDTYTARLPKKPWWRRW